MSTMNEIHSIIFFLDMTEVQNGPNLEQMLNQIMDLSVSLIRELHLSEYIHQKAIVESN